MNKNPHVLGMGVVTDTWPSIQAFSQTLTENSAVSPVFRARIAGTPPMEAPALEPYDALPRLAIAAAHQALSMASLITPEQKHLAELAAQTTGLLVISAWGAIDPTVAYLDSMLEADGRYASPRHFSRSVHSSVASLVAIHFRIHGPCETLSFPHRPITAAIERGRRLLAAGRCDRVLLIWADQRSDLAEDLARRAATLLGRRAYARYLDKPLGEGAVALLLANHDGVELPEPHEPPVESEPAQSDPAGKPYPMDAAVALLRNLLQS